MEWFYDRLGGEISFYWFYNNRLYGLLRFCFFVYANINQEKFAEMGFHIECFHENCFAFWTRFGYIYVYFGGVCLHWHCVEVNPIVRGKENLVWLTFIEAEKSASHGDISQKLKSKLLLRNYDIFDGITLLYIDRQPCQTRCGLFLLLLRCVG